MIGWARTLDNPCSLSRRLLSWIVGRDSRLYGLALVGGMLYVISGLAYGIDHVKCANWPSALVGSLSSVTYLLALGSMTAAWFGLAYMDGERYYALQRNRAVVASWIVASALHVCVTVIPPFLSDDTLAYGATGAALSLHGQPMYAPLGASLPTDDPYGMLIAQYPDWLTHGSTYGPGFNLLAALVVALAGRDVTLALHLFQFACAGAILLTGHLSATAAARMTRSGTADDAGGRFGTGVYLRTARLVLFCPLAVIEASSNAHNDAFLALAVAGFAALVSRANGGAAITVLTAGVTIKLSGLLLPVFCAATLFRQWASDHRKRTAGGVLVLLAAGFAFWVGWPLVELTATTAVRLIGTPDEIRPFCTRSLECAPRALLHFGLGVPWASWLLGLAFRTAAVVLMLVFAARARTLAQALAHGAAFLLFYYLFMHAYMQAWYLLSLLPLLSFLHERWQPVAAVFIVSSLAQYALDFLLACGGASPWPEIRESAGLLIVLAPPCLVLVWHRPALGPPADAHGTY